jgi:hypothetical protein
MVEQSTYAAFAGDRLLRSASLTEVLASVKFALDGGEERPILIFDNETGEEVDFDFRGSLDEILARANPKEPPRGPGRPRLGVEGREVTLLPRHWSWLQRQRGGASATLRRLVEEASRRDDAEERRRRTREAAYRFMSAMAGNCIGFEEAARALFAGDAAGLTALMARWPQDIHAHVLGMLELKTGGVSP